jgi:hypothetical protein
MHPYSVDSQERRQVLFILAILSVATGIGIGWLLSTFAPNYPLVGWLDAPSAMFIYGASYTGFDRWGWRLGFLRRVELVKTPDLEGTWEGHVRSSFDDHDEKHGIKLEIHQQWTRMEIKLYADKSTSTSRTGSLIIERDTNNVLVYEYLNEPNPDAPLDMHMHKGTAILTQQQEGRDDRLVGEYYSGRGRQRFGYIELKRK